MAFLGFEPQGRDGPCFQTFDRDGIARFAAITVASLFYPLKSLVYFLSELSGPVSGTKFNRPVCFGSCPVSLISGTGILLLKMPQCLTGFAQQLVLPGNELVPKILQHHVVHEGFFFGRLVIRRGR